MYAPPTTKPHSLILLTVKRTLARGRYSVPAHSNRPRAGEANGRRHSHPQEIDGRGGVEEAGVRGSNVTRKVRGAAGKPVSAPACQLLWAALLTAVAIMLLSAPARAGAAPTGVATDSIGNVYVTDDIGYFDGYAGIESVQKFTSTGAFITKWGSYGLGSGQFTIPSDVTTDAAGNVYVVDEENASVQKFTSDGNYVGQWGSWGSGSGQFKGPSDIATDAAGNVYVVDNLNDRIQKFTSNGTYVTEWGGEGTGDGQFDSPSGIAIDASGGVYVADYLASFASYGSHRIQKFTLDGTYVTQWGSYGTGNGQFGAPVSVATDAAGNVYVADVGNDSIQKFTFDGTYVTRWGSTGSGDGQFDYPSGVATDAVGNVYVADAANHRIQKFTSDGTYVTQWSNNLPEPEPAAGEPVPPPSVPGASVVRPRLSSSRKANTAKHTATFHFSSVQTGARFQCKLTGRRVPKALKRWRLCASPKRYKQLRPGKKVFWVRALLGGKASRPARHAWRIGNAPKRITIPTTARTAIFHARCTLARRCRAKVRIFAGKKTLARGRYSVPAHSNRKVRIPLTKAGRRAMQRKRLAPATLTIVDTRTGKHSAVAVVLRRRGN